jgi:acyl-CoA synthetase (AMP-forming)/AMP-acid ligase II
MNTLVALWNEVECKQPDKIAIIDADRRLSYRQLGERICRLSAGLTLRWKTRPGDVIALLAPNCLEFVISYFATVQAGAIVQPLDERLMPEEMKGILLDAGARFLIVHHALWAKFEKIRDGIPPVQGILGIGGVPDRVERFEEWVSHQPALPSRLTAV